MNGQGHARDVHICGQPAKTKTRPWPGIGSDLLSGKRSSAVATLAGRKDRFVMLAGLPSGHTADVVADVLARATAARPGQLRPFITGNQARG